MRSIPLRWRIIAALIGLALGTTLILALLARHFLAQSQSLQTNVNVEMGSALNSALSLAKENYDAKKRQLQDIGQLLSAPPHRDLNALHAAFADAGLDNLTLRVSPIEQIDTDLSQGPVVSKVETDQLQLVLALPDSQRALTALLSLEAFIDVENAVHTYKHIEMAEGDLLSAFLLAFLVAAAGVVLLASVIGVRIGFGITRPLHALLKGTREMARDNLQYRIPKGRNDEIGLLIESFNQMAQDLVENRRKRLEAEQIAAWREIARRLAHEIKNPLTPIQLAVQQMRDKYSGNDPTYQKFVTNCTEIVTEEVENLRSLVQEFADFARMPSLSLSPSDLNECVHNVVRLYPDARIHLDLTKNQPALELDAEQMRRVLINLIENGLDASGKNGQIEIRTHTSDDTAILSVIDSGPGVPLKDRTRIFQPYVSTKESGMGLGLAVVHNIIEDHGGHISVTDAPTGGAQFDIQLPIPDRAIAQLEEQR